MSSKLFPSSYFSIFLFRETMLLEETVIFEATCRKVKNSAEVNIEINKNNLNKCGLFCWSLKRFAGSRLMRRSSTHILKSPLVDFLKFALLIMFNFSIIFLLRRTSRLLEKPSSTLIKCNIIYICCPSYSNLRNSILNSEDKQTYYGCILSCEP